MPITINFDHDRKLVIGRVERTLSIQDLRDYLAEFLASKHLDYNELFLATDVRAGRITFDDLLTYAQQTTRTFAFGPPSRSAIVTDEQNIAQYAHFFREAKNLLPMAAGWVVEVFDNEAAAVAWLTE